MELEVTTPFNRFAAMPEDGPGGGERENAARLPPALGARQLPKQPVSCRSLG
jgi:hypothetical protein